MLGLYFRIPPELLEFLLQHATIVHMEKIDFGLATLVAITLDEPFVVDGVELWSGSFAYNGFGTAENYLNNYPNRFDRDGIRLREIQGEEAILQALWHHILLQHLVEVHVIIVVLYLIISFAIDIPLCVDRLLRAWKKVLDRLFFCTARRPLGCCLQIQCC